MCRPRDLCVGPGWIIGSEADTSRADTSGADTQVCPYSDSQSDLNQTTTDGDTEQIREGRSEYRLQSGFSRVRQPD